MTEPIDGDQSEDDLLNDLLIVAEDGRSWHPIVEQSFGPGSEPVIADADFPPGRCRFCEEEKGKVTFKKKAHVIPKAFGNTTIFSNSECDQCNAKYGQTIEDDLVNFLGPLRTFLGMKGYKGVPVFRRKQSSTPIRHGQHEGKNAIYMNEEGTDTAIVLHPGADGKSLACDIEYPPFELAAVGRALARMALFYLRAGEGSSFRHILEWVRGEVPWQPTIYEVFWGGGVSPNGMFMVLAPPLEQRHRSMVVCCVFAYMAYMLPLPKSDWTFVEPDWDGILLPFSALKRNLQVRTFTAPAGGRVTGFRRTIGMGPLSGDPQ